MLSPARRRPYCQPLLHFFAVATALVGLVGSGQSRAAVVHALDDGSSEFTVGFISADTGGGSFVFANQFTTDAIGEVITSISVSYGVKDDPRFAVVGTPIRVLLFRDQLGGSTPDHPVLLASAETTVMNPFTDTFNEVAITPTPIIGNFFIGVQASEVPDDGPFPISFDFTVPQNRSFAAFFEGPIAPDQVNSMGYDPASTSNDFPQIINTNDFVNVNNGNFMVRASGTPLPEPSTLFAALLLVGLAARKR